MAEHEIDAWFVALPETQKPILQALRGLIAAAVPEAREELKWSRPCYSTAHGLFCYLHTTKKHATLGFHQGSSLDDPKGLLEGTGADMRHIKVRSMDDVDATAFTALLKQAAARRAG